MIEYISDKLVEIYNDFKKSVDEENNICELKDFTFTGSVLPDYRNPLIQQFYLLKYLYGYFGEYVCIYREIIRNRFIKGKFEVLSLGCGCGLDLWGLKHACEEVFPDSNIERYNGIDVVEWKYRDKFYRKINVSYIDRNILDIEKVVVKTYNLIVFPKSIGEFSEEEFEHLLSLLVNGTFLNERIAVVGAMRKGRRDDDLIRFCRVIDVLQKHHGYGIRDCNDINKCGNNNCVADVLGGFTYPEEIKEYMRNLYKHCKTYIKNKRVCSRDCGNTLARKSISTMSQATYQIIYLERMEK